MKTKINVRLMMIALLAIITSVLSVTFIYYQLFQKQVRKDLSTTAKLLKDTHYFESMNIDEEELEKFTNVRITLINSNGLVLYDNDVKADSMTNHMDRPEIQNAFQNGYGESIRNSDTLHQNTYYYALLLENGTVLRVASDARSLLSLFLSVVPIIIFIMIVIIAVCFIFSHLLTKQLIRPIELLVENLDNTNYVSPYKELDPIVGKIKAQHIDILSAAKIRQDFTANVSHELKTPLTAILGYSELLEGDMVPSEQKGHFYLEIKKNANRLISLINDIIRLSQLDRNENHILFESIDLYQLVKECEEDLKISASQRNVSFEIEGERALIRGNREMIKELVENLVQNAIHYNNPQGMVFLRVKSVDMHVVLEVEDNGIGIPPDQLDRVFERFYRVDKSRSKATGGTGLGLAIVKHIMEIHEAKIEIQSELEKGTIVTVIF